MSEEEAKIIFEDYCSNLDYCKEHLDTNNYLNFLKEKMLKELEEILYYGN